jgi:hypothetical protein
VDAARLWDLLDERLSDLEGVEVALAALSELNTRG